MKKEHLYVVAAAIWGIPGIIISIKGISAYLIQSSGNLWWLFLVTIFVSISFFFIFRRIVNRYCARIASLTDKVGIWETFPVRGWLLLFFMMGLGISLKLIPGIPSEFFAGFYPGLGTALSIAGIRYFVSWGKALNAEACKCDGKHL
mgnify:CR=1 FL=1